MLAPLAARLLTLTVSRIFKDHFCRCWEEGITYEEYLKEIIKQTGVTPKLLGKKLQIRRERNWHALVKTRAGRK